MLHLIHFTSQEGLTSNDLFLLNMVKADKAQVFLECLFNRKKKVEFQKLNKRLFNLYLDKSKTYYMSMRMYETPR